MHPDGLWLGSATGGLHKPQPPARPAVPAPTHPGLSVRPHQGRRTGDTAHVSYCLLFNSFHPSKGLQSLLLNCFLFSLEKKERNQNTHQIYSCTLLTHPDSTEIIMCRVAPRNEEAILHIIIEFSCK